MKRLDFSIGEGSDNEGPEIDENRRFSKVKGRLGGVDESIGFNTRGSSMSCWVVPSLAAELWRMPLDQVLKLMRDGSVPTKEEEGFTFIDVAPNSPKVGPTFLPAADEDDVDVLLVDGDQELLSDESDDFGDWKAARARISLTRIGPPKKRVA